MNDEVEIVMSSLCRSFDSEGKTVQIDIFGDGDGGWLLEVIDQYGNSTWTIIRDWQRRPARPRCC